MKHIPILYSTPMVQALLEDRKTMTRRVVKSDANEIFWNPIMLNGYAGFTDDHGRPVKGKYSVRDVLWCRETYYAFGCWQKSGDRTKGGKDEWQFIDKTKQYRVPYHYEVNDDISKISIHTIRDGEDRWYKRPSIFMPKDACRLFLKVTDVRVERLQDISEEDAVKEGICSLSKDAGRTYKYGIPDADGMPGIDDAGWPWQEWEATATGAFKKLWLKINGEESWNSSPWVWVVSFKKTERPEGFIK